MQQHLMIQQTQHWIKSVVIDLNFCPFAAKAMFKGSIRYVVIDNESDINDTLINELHFLDIESKTETTFIIFNNIGNDFKNYLSIVKKAEKLITKNKYDGIYQLASFHPEYCFAGADTNDAANYTNRSMYPMLHILREESITKALALYPKPEKIPVNNIKLAQTKGLHYMQMLRASCF